MINKVNFNNTEEMEFIPRNLPYDLHKKKSMDWTRFTIDYYIYKNKANIENIYSEANFDRYSPIAEVFDNIEEDREGILHICFDRNGKRIFDLKGKIVDFSFIIHEIKYDSEIDSNLFFYLLRESLKDIDVPTGDIAIILNNARFNNYKPMCSKSLIHVKDNLYKFTHFEQEAVVITTEPESTIKEVTNKLYEYFPGIETAKVFIVNEHERLSDSVLNNLVTENCYINGLDIAQENEIRKFCEKNNLQLTKI